MKSFADLSEREILAVAIAAEEEDRLIYLYFAEQLEKNFPKTANIYTEMANEESVHRAALYDLYQQKFGDNLPPIRRDDVRGFLRRRPVWLTKNLPLKTMSRESETMEFQAARFYSRAAEQTNDVAIRRLLTDLALAEKKHENTASRLRENISASDFETEEATWRRIFLLQYIQPGLAGLMDGSVSTLAPLFAAAFATQSNWRTFLIGLAAAVGAGISMGFSEAMSDDGSLTGRGSPLVRGVITGLMTALGGLGHTLPYLIPDSWPNGFTIANVLASSVVVLELWIIAYIRSRYMDSTFWNAALQIVLGGIIVVGVGILIGSA